ncbi:hypothetical protein JAAARDRAFT_263162 [Jaapia argillacea MUCL 33604]|uniref:SHSP domain-containing protein n=1 Tax=Jaapia argillacea MUCL 33604 TaxID=933084 RepID=A0A067PU88_9AGAM|nr:hypothetical protein JAAARDRAFT_263162 [Jaapia argillacea MUCL 33604]
MPLNPSSIPPSSPKPISPPPPTSSCPSLTSSTSSSSLLDLATPLQSLSLIDQSTKQPYDSLHDSDDLHEEMKQWMGRADENKGILAGSAARPRSNSKTHSHLKSQQPSSPPGARHPDRPSRPPRQLSFQKRHASFDTPRAEIPLPSPRNLPSPRHPLTTPSGQYQYSSFPFPNVPPQGTTATATITSSQSSPPQKAQVYGAAGAPIETVTAHVTASITKSSISNSSFTNGMNLNSIFHGHPSGRASGFNSSLDGFEARSASSSSGGSGSSSTTSLLSTTASSPPSPPPAFPLRPPKLTKSPKDVVMVDEITQGRSGSGKVKEVQSQSSSPSHSRSNSQSTQQRKHSPAREPIASTTIAPDSTPITPYSRPYSTHSESFGGAIYSPKPLKAWDRSSTASLPLPCQTPYHVLPALAGTGEKEDSGKGTEREERNRGSASFSHRSASPPLFDYTGERSPSPTMRRLRSPPLLPPLLSRESASLPASTSLPPALIAYTRSLQNRTPEVPRTPSASGIPQPAPPTILTPPLPESRSSRRSAAYEPFLSHAPPPIDSWIAVETLAREYRLLVRLPGFKRDAITLATRRRRILHVVADSWEPTGGHFERRISFGYDADLAHVRAEFDGDMLTITVPRRSSNMTWLAPSQQN